MPELPSFLRKPGIRPEAVLINLVQYAKEDWSFGSGVASYTAL